MCPGPENPGISERKDVRSVNWVEVGRLRGGAFGLL